MGGIPFREESRLGGVPREGSQGGGVLQEGSNIPVLIPGHEKRPRALSIEVEYLNLLLYLKWLQRDVRTDLENLNRDNIISTFKLGVPKQSMYLNHFR